MRLSIFATHGSATCSRPSNRGNKLKLYECCGVPEYWLVDARIRLVEVSANAGADFTLQEVYAENQDTVRTLALQDFEMTLANVFEGI